MRPGPGFKTNSAFTNALHAEKGMMFMDEVKTAKQWNKKQQSEAGLVNIFFSRGGRANRAAIRPGHPSL